MTEAPSARLVTWAGIIITDGCNFRCGMCDYWKTPRPHMLTAAALTPLAGHLLTRGLRGVTITGGEPFLNKDWHNIAQLFHPHVRVNISTNGSLLSANAGLIGELVSKVIVSIDGASRDTFRQIRGVDRLEQIWGAMESLKRQHPSVAVCAKMTIQRDNVLETRRFLELALQRPWLDGVGFAIPDFSMEAFSLRATNLPQYSCRVLPDRGSLPQIRREFEELVHDHKDLYESGYIFEGDLLRYVQRFEALYGLANHPSRNCGIPREVLTVHADGRVSGCYFQPSDSCVMDLCESGGAGIDQLMDRRSRFTSLDNNLCQRCDQLLFTRSPLELTVEGNSVSP